MARKTDLPSVGYKLLQRLPNEISQAIFLRLSPFDVEDCPEEWNIFAESIYRDACIENRFPLQGQTFRDSFFMHLRQISDPNFRPSQPPYDATYALQSLVKYVFPFSSVSPLVEVNIVSRQFAYQDKALTFGLEILDRIESNYQNRGIKLIIGNAYQADLVARKIKGFRLRKENTVRIRMKSGPNGLQVYFFGTTLYYIEHDGCYRLYSVNLFDESGLVFLSALPIPDKTLVKLAVYPPHVCLLCQSCQELYYYNMKTNNFLQTPTKLDFLQQTSVVRMEIVTGRPCMENPILFIRLDEIFGQDFCVHLPLTEDSICFMKQIIAEYARFQIERIDEKHKCLVVGENDLLVPFVTTPFLPHFFFVRLPTFKRKLCYQRKYGDHILIVV